MMVHPEAYYISHLKGKSVEHILSEIKILRREISSIKREAEGPILCWVSPSYDMQISYTRQYLERAKQALIEAGGEYEPTKAEIKDELFNQNVGSIKNIYFEKTVHDIAICRSIFFDKDKVYAQKYNEFSKYNDYEIEELKGFKTEHFIKAIKDLHLGEWRRNYDMSKYDLIVLDGIHWKLEINFGSGYVERYQGHSMYPYNFNLLEMLLNFNEEAFGNNYE